MTNKEIDDFRRDCGEGRHSMLAVDEICAQAKKFNELASLARDACRDNVTWEECRELEMFLNKTLF